MKSGITLRKGRFSGALLKSFQDYYRDAEIDRAYTTEKWQEWTDHPDIVTYVAKKDHKTAGWIIYNPRKSTIEEVLVNGSWRGRRLEAKMIDALIAKENLVAAEILKADKRKYRLLVEYGFRPTRSFDNHGFSMVKMDLSIVVLIEKLKASKPATEYIKTERVAMEKVPETLTENQIREAVGSLIDKLGGLTKFVKAGQRVVIKPNIVSDHGLRDGVYKGGIVTDVRVVRALVELLLPVAGKVIIAEGSSINRSETTRMFAHYGYDKLVDLDPEKVSLVDLNTDVYVEKAVPGEKRMASRKIPLTLDEADVIINVPVLKLHFAAGASLSIKSLQGAVPPIEKYMTHFFGLWQNLVNIHHLVKPKLTIIDGLTGQEGFGPVSGTPKTMNLLIGGVNPVAVDAVAMRVMGLDPLTSPPLWMAYMQGLGPVDPRKIRVIGPSIKEMASPFKQPQIDITGGQDITIHVGNACGGCAGYLHFALSKLRRPDPCDETRLLIDRPFGKKVNIYLGPANEQKVNREARNIFMGICQQHNAELGAHLPGCPPHAEVIANGIFALFPDVEKPRYADESEEKKLGEMLTQILDMK